VIESRSFLISHDAGSGVVTITLNRPERLNALTFEVYRELRDGIDALGTDDSVRAIVVTGTGRAFCSGGDVDEIIGVLVSHPPEELRAFTRLTCDLVRAVRACPRPIVAAVNGTAAGGGAVLAAACDIRVAARSARIAFLFTKVGLSGADMGAAWLLPRLVGLGRATELLMTGEFLSASEALGIGLYNRVVADEDALPGALTIAESLARGPRDALAATKRALDAEAGMTLKAALEFEAGLQAELMTRPDFRRAYEAFRRRRTDGS